MEHFVYGAQSLKQPETIPDILLSIHHVAVGGDDQTYSKIYHYQLSVRLALNKAVADHLRGTCKYSLSYMDIKIDPFALIHS